MSNIKERIVWVDWMKVIGILLIIMGHLTPPGFQYLYTFTVPLFFVISGYLTLVDDSNRFFWKKQWLRLVCPSLILWGVANTIYLFTPHHHYITISSCISCLYGSQEFLGPLWFVYTLLICRMILQYSKNISLLILINIICVLCSTAFLHYNIEGKNAILNVAPAMPFFTFGYWIKKYKTAFNSDINRKYLMLTSILLLGITIAVFSLNDAVWMHKNGYGNDFSLFFIGGVSGTGLIFCVSKLLQKYTSSILVLLSNGTLVILALHIPIIRLFNLIGAYVSVIKYVIAIVVLLLFIPILMFCKKYIPILAR